MMFPLDLYKRCLMKTATDQDAVIEALASAAEDEVCRYVGCRLAADPSVPVTESLHCINGIMLPTAVPVLSVVSGAGVGATFTRVSIRSPLDDGVYEVTYTAGYSPSTLPPGLRGAILMMVKRMYDRGDATAYGMAYDDLRDMVQTYMMRGDLA